MVDYNGTSGLSLLIQSLITEQKRWWSPTDRIWKPADSFKLAWFTLPDSFKITENHARQFWFLLAFYSPLSRGVPWVIYHDSKYGVDHEWYIMTRNVGVVQVRRRSRNPNQRMAKWSSPLTTLFPVSTNTQRRLQKTTIVNKWGLKLHSSTWPLSKYCIRSKFPTQSSVA